MADDITVKFTADDRDLVTSYIRQGDKLLKLQEQLRRMAAEAKKAGDEQRKASDASAKAIEKSVSTVASLAGGWISAAGAVTMFIAENKKAIEDAEKQAGILEDISKKYAMISGSRGAQSVASQKAIRSAAFSTATSKEQAGAAAVQLVSSGMDPKEVENGGLKAFLETLNAAGLTGKSVDSETLARSMSAYLESQGIAKTAGNFRQYGAQIQRLAGPTNLGFSGINALAGEGASLAVSISPEEQLAAYADLVGSFKDADAATALRNVVGRLGTAGTKNKSVGTLKSMGLKPEDVDFTGEDLGTVLDRMAGGLDKLPEKDRDDAMKILFEEAGVAPAMQMIRNRAKIQENIETQKDLSGFDKDVAFAQSGRNAAGRRLELEAEYQQADKAGTYGMTRQAMQNAMRENGFSPFSIGIRSGTYDMLSGLGMSPEMALGAVAGNSNVAPQIINGTMDRVGGAMSAQNSADLDAKLDALRQSLDKNTQATEKANPNQPRTVPAPGPRPTAGAGRP